MDPFLVAHDSLESAHLIMANPRISIVIPVYNEQAILHAAVIDLRERLKPFGWNYEIILAENGSKDRSMAYSGLLRVVLGFRGTDTHGLKAFRRLALLDIVRACLVDKDVFASEFVIRADRAAIAIKEIPVRILEKRPPSINLFKRVPNVLKSVAKLAYAIRVRG